MKSIQGEDNQNVWLGETQKKENITISNDIDEEGVFDDVVIA